VEFTSSVTDKEKSRKVSLWKDVGDSQGVNKLVGIKDLFQKLV
jgi:hypothetical protein